MGYFKSRTVYNKTVQEYREVTVVDGETAIKPYYYMRNGLLHVRFTVDRAMELSKEEEAKIKAELAESPSYKQKVFARHWNLLSSFVGKAVIHDGIKAGADRMKEMTERYGCKNKGC